MSAALVAGDFKYEVSDQTTRDSNGFTVPGGTTLLHVILMNRTSNPPAAAVWRDPAGSPAWNQALTLVATRTPPEGGSYSFFHYQLANPTAGAGIVRFTGILVYDYTRILCGAVTGDNAGAVRGYKEVRGSSLSSPITAVPVGNQPGDLMLMLWCDDDVFSSAHAPVSGTSQVGAVQTRSIGLSKVAAAVSDSLGLQFGGGAGAAVAPYWGAVAIAAAGDTTAPTLTSPVGNGGTLVCSGSVSTDEANGTLYVVATGSANAPSGVQVEAGQDHTGAAALRVVSQAVTATGSQAVASGAVSAGTRYLHFMHKDAAGNRSAVVSSGAFTVNAAPDTTAPTLTSPVGTGGTLVCSGSVSTNEANGTLYVVATGSATAPSDVQVEAGQDHTGAAALRVVSQAVTATGSQAVASGAVSAGTRYLHFMHKDAAGNRSAVVSSGAFTVNAAPDTTAPTLTSPVGTGGTLVCSGSVSTNEANGTLYVVATGSATAPSDVQVEAGQDHTGAAALRALNQPVTASGSQAVASGAVTAGTRYLHFMHKDAAGNRSPVVSSASFSVSGGGGGTVAVPAGINWQNQALTGEVYPRVIVVSDTPAIVASRTSVTADDEGGFSIQDPAIVAGQWYSVFPFDLTQDSETWQAGGWRVQAT